MKVAYDLIIIGNLAHSLSIAEYALKFDARTALINLGNSNDRSLFIDKYKNNYLADKSSLDYNDFLLEEKLILDRCLISRYRKSGLDIIDDRFKFIKDQKITIKTSRDTITTSDYLIDILPEKIFTEDTPQSNSTIALDEIILRDLWSSLPTKIAIIGRDITAIYLAIRLLDLGKDIILFGEHDRLLPYEDEDISWQLQLYLEAKGIKFYLGKSSREQIDLNRHQYEKIILTEVEQSHDYDFLNLSDLGVKIDRHQIIVNSKLQTHNPNIYACGDSLGGYRLDNITEYEAKIAVENALFFPWQQTDYSQVPYCLPTNPPICRVGYTEKQARLLYGREIKIIRLNTFVLSSNWVTNNTYNNYFIKIITDRSQRILGFHCLGEIPEILSAVVVMIKNDRPLNYLFKLNFTRSSTYEIVKNIQQIWKQEKQGINDKIADLTKTFLIWKNG